MTKGILIFALGHINYYRMAEVLAASLIDNNATEDSIGICLVCDDTSKIKNPELFSETILLDKQKFTVNDKIVFNNATIAAYDLSRYDITIKLDADIVWIKNRPVIDLFNQLEDVDIAFETTGHGWNNGNSVWVSEDVIKENYTVTEADKLYKIFGEFLYFKKTKGNKAFFKTAKGIYRQNKVKLTAGTFSNGTFTDELAYQLAAMLTSTYPHKDVFTPIYNKYLRIKELSRKYPYELTGFYGYSIGGNVSDDFTKKNYDNLAKYYFSKLGLSNPYQVSNKRSFLPERKPA